MNEQPRWAIIGGGMMGLTLAHRLSAQSQCVTVIESRSTLGGLADAWQLDGVTWDRHYHVILLSDSKLRGILEELGLSEEIRWVETKTGFYAGGKFYSMSSAIEFLMFPPLRLIEKFRLGLTIFYASKIRNWKRMEKLLVADWLSRWSGASTFRKMWLPLLRAKLGDAYQRTAASFIWAYIGRMYKARGTGLKKEMFGYVRGGYARILARFGDALQQGGAEIKLQHAVRRIRSRPDGRVEIEYATDSSEHEKGESEIFDHVIVTTAAPLVSKLCPELTADEKRRFSSVEYLGIVCASLLLRRPLRGYYVTNITDDVPFTAVIETSTVVDRSELGGYTLVYLPKYVSLGDPVIEMSDEQVEAQFTATLRKMYPELQPDDIAAFRISRVRYVMAIPTLGYSEKLPPVKTSIPGVYAINSSLILKGVLNVNETMEIAEQEFQRTLQPIIRRQQEVDAPV